MHERPYDIIVWGASGFTGRIVVDYMHQEYGNGNLRWAVAGRNPAKLESVVGGRDIPILNADSHDDDALRQLVQQTKVILTTVGPYARYGSKLVAACAEHGTDYCDLTGESLWMREMISAHQQTAKDSGARIVHTCGFDSIPSDIGVFFLQKEMQRRHGVAARHIKYRTKSFKGGFSGGTIDSMMAMMEAGQKDPSLLKQLGDPYLLNDTFRGADGPDRLSPYFDEDFNGWVGPFMMAAINTRVVRRTNELLDGAYGENFRYDEGSLTGAGPKGFLGATGIGVGSGVFAGLASLPITRKGLQKVLPKPGEGPSPEQQRTGYFEIEMRAKHPDDASKNLVASVKGDRDPGYGSTAKMIAESALALAHDDLPAGGGFWTPASAMGDALLERLPANAGVTFEIVE